MNWIEANEARVRQRKMKYALLPGEAAMCDIPCPRTHLPLRTGTHAWYTRVTRKLVLLVGTGKGAEHESKQEKTTGIFRGLLIISLYIIV